MTEKLAWSGHETADIADMARQLEIFSGQYSHWYEFISSSSRFCC